MNPDIHIPCIIPSEAQPVTIVLVAVVVALVAKVAVWAEAVIDILVEDLVIINVRVDEPADMGLALECLVTVSHAVDVVGTLINAVLPDCGVDVLATVLEFMMPTSLEEFSC